jgi:hypothetical protein
MAAEAAEVAGDQVGGSFCAREGDIALSARNFVVNKIATGRAPRIATCAWEMVGYAGDSLIEAPVAALTADAASPDIAIWQDRKSDAKTL